MSRHKLQPTFDIVEDNSNKKKIIIGIAVLAVLIIGGGTFFFLKSKKGSPAQAIPQRQAQTSPSTQPQVQVQAKDPSKQAEVDQRVAELKYYIKNPTLDDAKITVGWLVSKYQQPPNIIVRDIKVLTSRLAPLSDQALAAFFNSTENPWHDSDSYRSLIKIVSYRDYVSFAEKCALLFEKELLSPPAPVGNNG